MPKIDQRVLVHNELVFHASKYSVVQSVSNFLKHSVYVFFCTRNTKCQYKLGFCIDIKQDFQFIQVHIFTTKIILTCVTLIAP